MYYVPTIDEARRDIRSMIAEARRYDEDAAAGVIGVVDVARLSLRRAWREYRKAQRIARPDTEFDLPVLVNVYAELKRVAAGRSEISGGWNWRTLDAITGGDSFKSFDDMRALGWLSSRTIPDTYGHQAYTLLR